MTAAPHITLYDYKGHKFLIETTTPDADGVVKLRVSQTSAETDGVEALLATLNGYTDGLETLVTATNALLSTLGTYTDGIETLLTALSGYVDGLEALAGSTNTKLDTLIAKDFSTQATLAAVLAKLIAAPATEAKQDTGNTSLASILAKIIAAPSTEAKQDTGNASLASILAKIIAAPATEAKQDSAITQETATAAVLGTTAGAKVITDAAGTIQQYLRGLISQWISYTLTVASIGHDVAVSITRTNDTNAYLANDVIGAATGSTAALTFANIGQSGKSIEIIGCQFEIDAAAIISGETSYLLHLYNVTPPSALGDNAPFDLPAGDRASYLGQISLGAPVDLGSTLYCESNGLSKQVILAGTSLFGYLVTVGGYTSTASRVHVVTLHTREV